MSQFRNKIPKFKDCIVSADEFDGCTGIEELVENYQAQKPCKLTVKDRIEMMHSEGKVRDLDASISKKCRLCGRELSIVFFHRSRWEKHGVSSMCKDCDNEYRRILRRNKLLS